MNLKCVLCEGTERSAVLHVSYDTVLWAWTGVANGGLWHSKPIGGGWCGSRAFFYRISDQTVPPRTTPDSSACYKTCEICGAAASVHGSSGGRTTPLPPFTLLFSIFIVAVPPSPPRAPPSPPSLTLLYIPPLPSLAPLPRNNNIPRFSQDPTGSTPPPPPPQ